MGVCGSVYCRHAADIAVCKGLSVGVQMTQLGDVTSHKSMGDHKQMKLRVVSAMKKDDMQVYCCILHQ